MMDRRGTIASLAAAGLALGASPGSAAPPAPRRSQRPATFVLVHGAGSGGWTWGKLTPLLLAAGHRVYTPTLTGVGERRHLLRSDTGLETHIQDVLGVLRYEQLSDVILAGHSYGGMVITGVADRAPEQVGQLVYLDASHPRDGESLAGNTPAMMSIARRSARVENGVEVVLGNDSEAVRAVGSSDPAVAAWKNGRYSPWPWKAFADPLELRDQARVLAIPRTSINCLQTMRGRTPEQARRARAADRVWEIDTTHDLMVTEPEWLADKLLQLPAAS